MLYRHARIAQPRPRQSIERGNLSGHLVKQAFDAHKAVLAGHVEHQFAQEFPFRPGVPGGLDRLHEFLHAAFGVGERAAFLRMGAAGQEVMREPGRLAGQDVAHDERLQFAQQVRAQPVPGHVLAEHNQAS